MKALVCFILLLPLTVAAQDKRDYTSVMTKFQHFYNSGRGDSISAMFNPPSHFIEVNPLWTNERAAEALKEFGTLTSFTYIGVDESDHDTVRVFQTFFTKAGARTTSLTLHANHKLGTFRFMTSSDGIDALLRKQKPGK